MSLPISVCIITLNEEDNIRRCLESVLFADEILVMDSGSTDSTLQICKEFSVTTHTRKFDTYPSQKNACIALAKNEWVLALDADEAVSPELVEELKKINFAQSKNSAYSMPRMTYYLSRWIKWGGWYPNRQTRLFRKTKGQFSPVLVHERVQVDGKILPLSSPLLHFSYKNISDHLKFIDRYSDLTAREKFKSGKNSGVLLAFFEGSWKFISMYFVRFGFLDGKAGFVLAILGFYYNFLKYLKLYELGEASRLQKDSVPSGFVVVDSVHDIKSEIRPTEYSNEVNV